MIGYAYVGSLFFLTFVVCTVYSLAREVNVTSLRLARETGRRAAQLLGLLAALAVVVYFLSKI
jgi:hypothetical protein